MNDGDKQQRPTNDQDGNASWQYKPEDAGVHPAVGGPETQAVPAPEPQEVTWTASEFVAHQKNVGWYGLLALAGGSLAALAYLFTKDWITVSIIILVVIVFGIAAARKPRVLTYRITHNGLTIGQKAYPFADFKSFSVVQEGAVPSVTFMPLRRFQPPLSIYYDPADEDRILTTLSQYLPFENRGHDIVDRFISRIRF